ncbi:MAG: SDR family oxidoreductase, partial [Gammaproteobacteria bacterium]|nr:SDR family oxidoreductase [Gammaproteobacteria bacterium]
LHPVAAYGGMRMAAQSVVITGSTQGLGFGYAREFVRRGHQVVVSGRGEARVKAAVERLGSEFPDARQCISGFACEISELEQVRALWDHGVASFGRIDIWLNNAGYARTGAEFADNTSEEIEAMVRANVIGSFNAAQTAVAGMARQGGGKLYLTLGGGGASGRVVPGMTVYSTTKRAVKYLANCLVKERRELHDESILIGTISPGINITEGMLREMRTIPQAQRARALKQLNFIGEHVETTTPWIVERVLNDRKQGNDITWLTGGRLAGRALAMMFGARRDVVSRYSFEA